MKRTQPKEFQPMRKPPTKPDCPRCYGSGKQSILIDGYWYAKPCNHQPQLFTEARLGKGEQ